MSWWNVAMTMVLVIGVGCSDDGNGSSSSDTGGGGNNDVETPLDTSGNDISGEPDTDTSNVSDNGSPDDSQVPEDTGSIPDVVEPKGIVVINEVVHSPTGGGTDWVELYNRGEAPVDLSGHILRDDDDTHIFVLPQGTKIAAGAYLMIYGVGGSGDLVFDYGLGASDAVRLSDTVGNYIDIADWEDGEGMEGTSFGRYPNGTGSFSTLTTPTPGAENAPPQSVEDDVGTGGYPDLVINEVVAATTDGGSDWVELYNPTSESVNLGGWYITDKPKDPLADWTPLGEGFVVPAKGYLVLYGVGHPSGGAFGFGLGADDDFALANPDGELMDKIGWKPGQAPPGYSFGRSPNLTGDFRTLVTPTPGGVNGDPYIGPGSASAEGDLVITEMMIQPAKVTGNVGEWFEVYNPTDSAIDINGWILSDDGGNVHFLSVKDGISVAPKSYFVLAASGDTDANGGVVPDYVYGPDISWSNTADGIFLISAGRVVDHVVYDTIEWSMVPGSAHALSSDAMNAEQNDDAISWCPATKAYGKGDLGTPGTANGACP